MIATQLVDLGTDRGPTTVVSAGGADGHPTPTSHNGDPTAYVGHVSIYVPGDPAHLITDDFLARDSAGKGDRRAEHLADEPLSAAGLPQLAPRPCCPELPRHPKRRVEGGRRVGSREVTRTPSRSPGDPGRPGVHDVRRGGGDDVTPRRLPGSPCRGPATWLVPSTTSTRSQVRAADTLRHSRRCPSAREHRAGRPDRIAGPALRRNPRDKALEWGRDAPSRPRARPRTVVSPV